MPVVEFALTNLDRSGAFADSCSTGGSANFCLPLVLSSRFESASALGALQSDPITCSALEVFADAWSQVAGFRPPQFFAS